MRLRTKALVTLMGGLLSIGATASAATITYSTAGTFGGPGSAGTSVTAGTATLDFDAVSGATVQVNPPPVGFANLGNFDLSVGNGTFAGNTFTVLLTQLAPPGSDSANATLAGQVTTTGGGVTLVFTDPTIAIGTTTYTVDPQLLIRAGQQNVDLNARVISAVPVPAAVWGGMSLLGALGGGRLWRRRYDVA